MGSTLNTMFNEKTLETVFISFLRSMMSVSADGRIWQTLLSESKFHLVNESRSADSCRTGTERRRCGRENRREERETLHPSSQQQSAAVIQRPQRMNYLVTSVSIPSALPSGQNFNFCIRNIIKTNEKWSDHILLITFMLHREWTFAVVRFSEAVSS